LRALSHALPVVTNVPLDAVVTLRREEPGAFDTYRDRIRRIASAHENSTEFAKEADELRKDFFQLESHIKSKKRSVLGKLASQVIIAIGTVGVGLAAGFFGIIPLEWGAIAGAAGGVPAAHKIAETVTETKQSEAGTTENPLYFLWKLSRARNKQ
jgi:hypothetical protein